MHEALEVEDGLRHEAEEEGADGSAVGEGRDDGSNSSNSDDKVFGPRGIYSAAEERLQRDVRKAIKRTSTRAEPQSKRGAAHAEP